MRGKSSIPMLLALLLVGSFLTGIGFSAPTKMKVQPPSNLGIGKIGTIYTIDIVVQDAVKLGSWEFKLYYNAEVLKVPPEEVIEGPFLRSKGDTYFTWTYSTYYKYVMVSCTLTEAASASGSGTLATIKLLILGKPPGFTDLKLEDTILVDINGNPIVHTAEDGYFYLKDPVALFTWTPANPIVGQSVVFDASGSFSPTGRQIYDYLWDFGDGSPIKQTFGLPKTTHVYSAYRYDPYIVTLTVVDEDGRTGSASQPLLIWRDVVASDIWISDDYAEGSYAVIDPTYVRTEYPPYPPFWIVLTATNLGTVTEKFNVKLEFSVETDLTPFWGNPRTLAPHTASGWSLSAYWFPTDAAGNPLPPGEYTFTMTCSQVPGETDALGNTANNVFTKTVTILGNILSVKPSEIEQRTPAVGKEFTVEIVADVIAAAQLYGFEFRLLWDPALIELVTSEIFPPWETSYIARNEIGDGYYWAAATALPPAGTFMGAGATLARLTFRIKYDPPYPEEATCTLDLTATELVDSEGNNVAHLVEDGVYRISSTPVILKLGDVNKDGAVNIYDLQIVGRAFGSTPGAPNWDPRADVNEDNIVNIKDLVLVAIDYEGPI